VAEFVLFGAQVFARVVAGGRAAGDTFDYANAGFFELLHFVGIVGEQADGLQSELAIGFDGIEALVLELVGLQFIDESDAAPFLGKVQDDSGRLFRDLFQGKFQLRAAVAALRGEDVSCKALGVHAHQRRFSGERAVLDGDGFLTGTALDAKNPEPPEACGQLSVRDETRAGVLFSLCHCEATSIAASGGSPCGSLAIAQGRSMQN
jgi:hypothetical protein